MRRAINDLLAGLTFIVFGLAFSVGATSYEIGTALSMGPGYFPLVLGGVLVVLGTAIVAKGVIAGEGGETGPVAWKAAVLIVAALVLFGLTVRGLGVVPSVFLTALLAGLAGYRARVVAPVVIAVGLTITSVLIFVVALQLPLPLFGPWLAV